MKNFPFSCRNYKKYLDEHTQIQTDAKNTIDLKKKYEEDSRRVSDTVRSLSQDCSSFKEQFEKAEDGLMKANGDLRVCFLKRVSNISFDRMTTTFYVQDMRRQAIDQERELKELSMVLKSYEQEFAEQADKNYVDRIKVIEDEIDVIKKKIAGRMANRLEVQEHINTTIKYDYITVENKLKTLESSRDSKLEVKLRHNMELNVDQDDNLFQLVSESTKIRGYVQSCFMVAQKRTSFSMQSVRANAS